MFHVTAYTQAEPAADACRFNCYMKPVLCNGYMKLVDVAMQTLIHRAESQKRDERCMQNQPRYSLVEATPCAAGILLVVLISRHADSQGTERIGLGARR
jgi:elongation factor P--beta-lysine ligase